MRFSFFEPRPAEDKVKHGLIKIQHIYRQITEMQNQVSKDVSGFFNYQQRESRLTKDIGELAGAPKAHRLDKAKQIIKREHGILKKEKAMLDDIRKKVKTTLNHVVNQLKEIEKIERNL